MDNYSDYIEDIASSILSRKKHDEIDRVQIREAVINSYNVAKPIYSDIHLEEEDIETITRKLEERFDITMSLGDMFFSDDYKPWLHDIKANNNPDWYYWNRYKRYLLNEKFAPDVVNKLDFITDDILDHMENPNKEGRWSRRGMVVGHVQSGKTANYTGLICKAADSGYKVIIVLAGLLNSLRNQTQIRIDKGFIGKCTVLNTVIGVGAFGSEKKPDYFTTSAADFKKSVATSIGVSIGNLRGAAILVVKKNKNSLENLIDWLQHNNKHDLKDLPMLLIDDEADHASINTNKGEEEATTINRKIRELLNLFGRASYVGYTATPFANIFIDPDSTGAMIGEDLFPRHFILSLDPPTNYCGPDSIFTDGAELNIVRTVSDYADNLPFKHPKDFEPDDLPNSLKIAIGCFILIRAIRLLRKQINKHHSMMVNVTRYTAVQTCIKLKIFEFLKQVKEAIICNYALPSDEALKNENLKFLYEIWLSEYKDSGFTWEMIQKYLKDAAAPIEVIEVNSSSSSEPLDYSDKNYPSGRNLIAVGGLGLSRGLTLEGLSVSYFLRNSIMYDTLMQMGRWFGYRDGYSDLCRIFMTEDAYGWYSHIAGVISELRGEFKRMKIAGMTPNDFGLCVRSHPESLIVTARNKMRSSTRILRQVSLEGRLVETSLLYNKNSALTANRVLLNTFIVNLLKSSNPVSDENASGLLWKEKNSKLIKDLIKNFSNHPISQLTSANPLLDYISYLDDEGHGTWDVFLASPQKGRNSSKIEGLDIVHQERAVCVDGDALAINKGKRRVGYAIQESAGLTSVEKIFAESEYLKNNPDKNISGVAYRAFRKQPLLILHILDCYIDDKDKKQPPAFEGVFAYAISFPGMAGSRRPKKLVEYEVNTVWWKNEYQDYIDEENYDNE